VTKKSKTQLEAELKALRSSRTVDGTVVVLQSLLRWGGIVAIAWFTRLAVGDLAGQTTLADIGIDFLGKVEVSVALAWTAGAAGGYYGYRQRKLRRDTVERLQKRVKELENFIDKNRSSSQLTSRGDTRPEDIV